ncbi:PAS domain S-box protein [Phormidium sp. LEGE 05292]|uniref:sensor histidine kinase n=1 Tax=[Phormidium] sp. LEGE 05292 TaxID=767427 RepID=UPI00187ED6AD|nr:PAS domain S-box protein [Phormidium sp. LEGE 05292]MBE9226529.1 PAS domain S-box protein [Phormidium sp. LEGE 05292]
MESQRINSLYENCLAHPVDRAALPIILAGQMQPQTEMDIDFPASLLAHINCAVIATDRDGKITYWNRYAETLYQWTTSEVMGQNVYEVILGEETEQQTQEIIEQLLRVGSWKGELFARRRDGSRVWVENTISPIKDDKSQVKGFVGVCFDATERHQVKEALRQSESTTQILFHAIPEAIFFIHKDGTIVDFQPAKQVSEEFSKSGIVSKKFSELLPKTVWQQVMSYVQAALSTGEMQLFEYQLLKKGKNYDFEARIIKSTDDEVLTIIRDITERKIANEQLAKSEDRYRIVSELISDFAYAAKIDSNNNFKTDWMTGAVSRITGYSCQEMANRGGWQTLIYPDDLPKYLEKIQNLLCWQSDISEYRIITKEGEVRWLRDYRQPVYCEDKERTLIVYGAAQDITERKQAEEALRQQTERERLLGMIHERIRQSLKIDKIIGQAVQEVRRFLQVERVTIYQVDEKGDGKFVVESVAENCLSILGLSLTDHCFKTKFVEKYQQGYISATNDIYQGNLSPCHLEILGKLQIRANLIVPIVFNSKLWGLLCVHNCTEPRNWQPFEIESLKQLAVKIAIAIAQSELYQQIKTLNEDLEIQVQERTAELQKALEIEASLKRITDKVRDSLDENQILQTAVRELAIGLGMNSCNASVYDLEKGTSTICFEHVIRGPQYKGRVAQMANFPELYDKQLLQKQYFQFCSIPINPERGRVAMLACPIVDNQGVLGDLWLVNHHDYGFSELEIRLVQQVANQCAIAIRQARLYQAAQAQVEELAKLNQLKDDFLSTVSHELRTPMANMKMAIQMLKIAPPGDRQQRYLQILQSECNRETELINDLLDLQRLEAASYPISLEEAINLPEWLPGIVEPFISRAQERGQILQTQIALDLSPLITDRAGLGRIVAELLNNACKYTSSGGKIILHVCQEENVKSTPTTENAQECLEFENSQTPVPDIISFTVKNQAEIPAEELPNVFKKFYRVPKSDLWKQGGTGLGLALVKKLVEQMQGNIVVESSAGWTTFCVELPNK